MTETLEQLEARLEKIGILMDHETMSRDLLEQATGHISTIPLPWTRLSEKTKALKSGCILLVGGPTKTGKSFLLANIAVELTRAGHKWAYLPLEDQRKDFLWRVLAILENDYQMVDDNPEQVDRRDAAMKKHWGALSGIGRMVYENPRVGHKNSAGETIVPAVPEGKILSWVKSVAATCRVVFVDPIAQIEFTGDKPWKAEGAFVRNLLAVATDTRATIVVCGHTVKRGGANVNIVPSVEDFQGAAEWTRLSHTVILIDGHETKTSNIFRVGGIVAEEEHNRTVVIGAARNGSGTRIKLAFNQSHTGPTFQEIGVIAPPLKRGKK